MPEAQEVASPYWSGRRVQKTISRAENCRIVGLVGMDEHLENYQ